MRSRRWYQAWIFLVVTCWSCHEDMQTRTLRIAVAANAQYALGDLTAQFEETYGVASEVIIGSSGKLTTQIRQGAPFDLFISADLKYPNTLVEEDLTLNDAQIYAVGKLVLWTMSADLDLSLAGLDAKSIKHIAIANPKIAPYGRAANRVLDHIDFKAREKLVIGESISQANQFIVSQAADLGFTAKSVVLAPQMRGKGRWSQIDDSLHDPILQGVVAVRNDRGMESEARTFIDFLLSEAGQKILRSYGYGPFTTPN